jgi:TolB protein
MLADGTGRRRLSDDPHKHWSPRWSPDGKKLASYLSRSGNCEICAINPDGSGLRRLTEVFTATWPTWSPDGSRLAFFNGTAWSMKPRQGP